MRDAAFGWLALGVVLHLANQVARGRGWCATVRLAQPDGPRCRPRDAVAAYRRYLELEESGPQAEKIKARIAQLETQS